MMMMIRSKKILIIQYSHSCNHYRINAVGICVSMNNYVYQCDCVDENNVECHLYDDNNCVGNGRTIFGNINT